MIFLYENYTENYSEIIIENQNILFFMKLNHFEKVNSFKTAVSLTNSWRLEFGPLCSHALSNDFDTPPLDP